MAAVNKDFEYPFKTTPFNHQQEEWERSRESKIRAILWEQGTGKSKLAIDTAGWMWYRGLVNAMVVVAPNGVQRNWVNDEIPTHLPNDIPVATHIFETKKKNTKYHQQAYNRCLRHKGFAVLVISYNAFMTPEGKEAVWFFLRDRECLYILDESHRIKGSDGKGLRAVAVTTSGNYATYKRIMTGTPISVGPFDLWMQISFLDPYFWKERGLATYLAFKHFFGVWRSGQRVVVSKKTGKSRKQKFKFLVQFKNLGVLKTMVDEISTRVLKTDVLDLPDKIYTKRYFKMSPKQQKLYDAIRDEFMVEYEQELITAPLAIVRLLRLQQITCGYIAADGGDPVYDIDKKNTRLEVLLDTLEDVNGKAIIWARFTRDIEQIKEALGDKAVTYHGANTPEELEEAKARFQGTRVVKDDHGQVTGREEVPEEEQAQYFVANQAMGSEGLTLTAAHTAIYYNNSFKFIDRLQSEDRCHRIGTTSSVNYIDIVAEETVDEAITENLRNKFDIAGQITGDKLKEWI